MSRRRKRGTQEERDRSTQLFVPRVFSIAQTPTKIHRIGLGREGERRCSEVEIESQDWERVINTLMNKNGN